MRFLSLVLITALALVAGTSMLNAKDGIPDTMEEAYRFLDAKLPPDQREKFKQMTEREAVVSTHFNLGMYIRNELFYSGKSALPGLLHSLGARHPDDVSGMVLTSYWRYLNNKPIELEKQGADSCRASQKQRERMIENAKKKGETYMGPDFSCPSL
jgi:hypothetical protein